jgi:hypothetical protein
VQALEVILYLRGMLGARRFERLVRLLASTLVSAGAGVLALLVLTGRLSPWTGRCVVV